VLFSLAALIVVGSLVDRAWIRANGVVAGELVGVSPIVQARLQQLFVRCLDHVKQGQRVAEFNNEATAEAAAQQLQQLELQLEQAKSQTEIAGAEAAAARKLVDAQAALLQQLVAVLQAQDELVKKQFVATLVWENAKAAVTRGEADKAAAEFVYATKVAERAKALTDADVLRQRVATFKDSPELNGHFLLTSPKDGIVTECTAHIGEVIAARSPIFQVFSPDDAYAIVFFDPADRMKLEPGERLNLQVAGIGRLVVGHVSGFYPELSALPSDLTRYFWQQERWSQYSPVRVDFEGLDSSDRRHLSAWAQLSASRWEWPTTWLAESARYTQSTWPWIRQQLADLGSATAEAWRKVTRARAEAGPGNPAAPNG
jgi:multidrug resistance efflux pump